MRRNRILVVLIGFALLTAIVIAPAAATTWYVDDDGGAGIDYTAIQPAIEAADPGDTIIVYDGNYGGGTCHYYGSGHFSDNCFSVIKQNLTLRGEGDVIIEGGDGGMIDIGLGDADLSASGSVIEGFKVVNSTDGLGVAPYSPDCIIRNCAFEGPTGIIHLAGSNVTFMNNVVSNSTYSTRALSPPKSNFTFVNNTIINSAGAAILLYRDVPLGNTTIARNNFINNGREAIWFYKAEAYPGTKIYLNNFVDNAGTVKYTGTPPTNIWNSTEQIQYVYDGWTYTNYLGNYWGSDYGGTDGDGDGIGNTAYDIPGSATDKDHRPLMAGFENYPAATQCVGNCYEGTCEGTLIGEMPCPVCLEEPGRSWKPNKDVFCFDATEPLDLCLEYCPQCCDGEDNDVDGKIDYPNDPECTCGLDPSEAPIIPVDIDVKPGSCPNPLDQKSKGVLPVAVLGTAEFDVTTIDPGTILLIREGCEGVAAPIRWSYEDVATPFTGELCDCHDLDGDGYTDLTLKFYIQELVSNLKLDEAAGETIPLTVTGDLKAESGGTPIEGKDCIRVQ